MLNGFFYSFYFLLGYIHCTGGFIVTNSKQVYIVHWLDYHLSPTPSLPHLMQL
jgi:hypothetical protein